MKPKISPGVVADEVREWNFRTVRLTIAVLPVQAVQSFYVQVGLKY
jgi:hypothetical protein